MKGTLVEREDWRENGDPRMKLVLTEETSCSACGKELEDDERAYYNEIDNGVYHRKCFSNPTGSDRKLATHVLIDLREPKKLEEHKQDVITEFKDKGVFDQVKDEQVMAEAERRYKDERGELQ